MNDSILNDSAILPSPNEYDRMMLRLGEVRTQSNPYMNPYNHSRPQNVSRIEGSFIEENPGFTTSVFRTGHLLRPTQQSEQEAELTSITTELLDCMCVWKLL